MHKRVCCPMNPNVAATDVWCVGCEVERCSLRRVPAFIVDCSARVGRRSCSKPVSIGSCSMALRHQPMSWSCDRNATRAAEDRMDEVQRRSQESEWKCKQGNRVCGSFNAQSVSPCHYICSGWCSSEWLDPTVSQRHVAGETSGRESRLASSEADWPIRIANLVPTGLRRNENWESMF